MNREDERTGTLNSRLGMGALLTLILAPATSDQSGSANDSVKEPDALAFEQLDVVQPEGNGDGILQ